MPAATIKLQLELCARVFDKDVGDISHEESRSRVGAVSGASIADVSPPDFLLRSK